MAVSPVLYSSLLLGVVFAATAWPYHRQNEELGGWSTWAGLVPGGGGGVGTFGGGDTSDPWAMAPPPVWRLDEEGLPQPLEPERPATRRKEGKRKHQRERDEEEEEDEEDDRRGGSRANASFNAWFPILLGAYPGSAEANTGRGWQGPQEPTHPSPKDAQTPEPSGGQDWPRQEPYPSDGGPGLAVVANSVNHGRSGLANSHAVIFTDDPLRMLPRRRSQQPPMTKAYRGYYR